jgi:hypothetical protein
MRASALGLTGFITLAVAVAYGDPVQLWHSYLVATLFFVSLGIGALFFVLTHSLARAGWHIVLRRHAENVMATIPVLGLLMIPLFLHLGDVYPWITSPIPDKAVYLNEPAFIARSAVYLAVWSLIAWWFRWQSTKQDQTKASAITRRLQTASAPALILFGITVTFAAFDWLMSLDPHWYSSIFGVYFFAGSAVGFFALLVLLTSARGEHVSLEHFHGLGKLLFGFVCFWAYIAFSQYLLIWYADIPEETIWFRHRFEGSWALLSALLALGHFVLPFFFFLSVRTKTGRALRVAGAGWLLAMHVLDLYWVVLPGVHPRGISFHWLDVTTLVGVGLVFFSTLNVLGHTTNAIPESDPRLSESLSFHNA